MLKPEIKPTYRNSHTFYQIENKQWSIYHADLFVCFIFKHLLCNIKRRERLD